VLGSTGGRWKRNNPRPGTAVHPGRCAEKRHHQGLGGDHLAEPAVTAPALDPTNLVAAAVLDEAGVREADVRAAAADFVAPSAVGANRPRQSEEADAALRQAAALADKPAAPASAPSTSSTRSRSTQAPGLVEC
jgi:hypothetical protein